MAKFNVAYDLVVSGLIEVEADSEDAAIDKVEGETDLGLLYRCASSDTLTILDGSVQVSPGAPDDKKKVFKVAWDNGASACGVFQHVVFYTYEDADAWGRNWADECNLRDFGSALVDGEGYTYEVVESESDYEDDSPDGTSGSWPE